MQENSQVSSALERRLDIAVAIADLDKDVDERLKRMGKSVKLPGFRPGKVPFNMVKQQYGAQARHEALADAVDKAFGEAVTAQKLRVAGYPRIEAKKTESDTQLEFSAIFEVYPEITLGDVSTTDVERLSFEVGAA
jgi:trigger factor